MRPTLIRITYDIDYMEELKERGTRGMHKSMAYLYYVHSLEIREDESSQYYANVWGVCKTTAWEWIKEFDTVIG